MSETRKTDRSSRRDFLKLAATSAPAAVAAVATGTTSAEAAPEAEAKQGLQDTAQTRTYYQSARF